MRIFRHPFGHSVVLLLALLFTPAAILGADSPSTQPWETRTVGIESGLLWQVRDSASLSYRLVPTELSWRSSEFPGWGLSGGSRLAIRHRAAFLGSWVQQGPESYYVAVNLSPSFEFWEASGTWSVFAGAGGGIGLTDSRGMEGGQGQDLTFHWFARAGVERFISPVASLNAGIRFLHLSNLGLTDPNPGIDALGFTLGYTRGF